MKKTHNLEYPQENKHEWNEVFVFTEAYMIIITGIVLIRILYICFLIQNQSTRQIIVDNSNKAIYNYTN